MLKDWTDKKGLADELQTFVFTCYKYSCSHGVEHGYYVRTAHQKNTFEKYIFDGITKAGFDVLFARAARESPLVLFSHVARATRESPLVILPVRMFRRQHFLFFSSRILHVISYAARGYK